MAELSQQSFCTQCHKEKLINGKSQLNNLFGHDMHQYKSKNLDDAQTQFHKLQRQIIKLKEQNQGKIHTIETLRHQLNGSHKRKSSVEIQIQENKKSFQQLKNSLLSFGNQGFKSPDKPQPNRQSVSTQLIINSLQKRLKEYKIELLKVIEKVELHEKSTEWMYQFIDTFLKMVLEINKTGRYGEPLVLKELSIKKRTRMAWKYLKDILEKILNGDQITAR